jgi:hypothetical protein
VLQASEIDGVRADLFALAGSWRQLLADDPMNARPIVSSLLRGRVTFTPTDAPKRWTVRGEGTLSGLFSGEIFPSMWRPQCQAVGTTSCLGFERSISSGVPRNCL